MERNRKIKTLSLVALIVAVLGLGVAFAALSSQLTINGSAKAQAGSWNIHFAKTLDMPTQTTGNASFTEPTLYDTSILGFKATVTKPGDSVTYYFDIVNSGTVDALVDNYVFESGYQDCAATRVSDHPECKLYDFNSDGVINGSDYSVIKASIKYGLYYTDNNKEIIAGDEIRAGETKHAKLVVEYFSGSIFLLPDGLQITSIKNTPITIDFVQSSYGDEW